MKMFPQKKIEERKMADKYEKKIISRWNRRERKNERTAKNR